MTLCQFSARWGWYCWGADFRRLSSFAWNHLKRVFDSYFVVCIFSRLRQTPDHLPPHTPPHSAFNQIMGQRFSSPQEEAVLFAPSIQGNLDEVKKQFSFEIYTEQYETAVLDMCRLLIAYAWSRFEPVDKDDKVGCARTINKNSYNKSMPNVIWLMSRCNEILKSRGV